MKKLIPYLFVLGFVGCSFSLRAQGILAGVKGGISIPNLSAGKSGSNALNSGYTSRLGPDAALFVNFSLSNNFSIQPMIEYSAQGGKRNGVQPFPTPAAAGVYFSAMGQTAPKYLYGNFKNEVKLNYLMLPILAKYGIDLGEGSPFRLYADAGPFAALLLNAKDVTSGSSSIYVDAAGQQALPVGSYPFTGNSDIKSSLNHFNAGIEGNLGLAFRSGASSVFIEGGGNYGFMNIQKDAANGNNKTGAVTATIGYSYRFGE